jgi:hypothetical protein
VHTSVLGAQGLDESFGTPDPANTCCGVSRQVCGCLTRHGAFFAQTGWREGLARSFTTPRSLCRTSNKLVRRYEMAITFSVEVGMRTDMFLSQVRGLRSGNGFCDPVGRRHRRGKRSTRPGFLFMARPTVSSYLSEILGLVLSPHSWRGLA